MYKHTSDIVGSAPNHNNKAAIALKQVTDLSVFSAYESSVYTIFFSD